MADLIKFYDEETDEKILFEVVDSMDLEGQRYILVADQDNDAALLKEVEMGEEEITYELIEDDNEFQKIAVLFFESDKGYLLEF